MVRPHGLDFIMTSPARPKIGLKDVAREADVALSTVSHVLNGTAPISTEVRERVLEIARRLGYLEKRKAKASIATLNVVLLAMPKDVAPENELNLVSWNILNGLRKECERRGIRIVPLVGEAPRLDAAPIIALAKAETVNGLVVFNDDRPELLRKLHATGLPIVLINGEDPNMLVDSVTPENRFAARQGTSWLLTNGHRRILHMTWRGRTTIRRRCDGFVDAFVDHGLPPPAGMVLEADGYTPEMAERAIDTWLKAASPDFDGVTAIFCAADNLALGTLRALSRHGIKVPEQISVMGFDNIMLGEFSNPSLATIHVPLDRLGASAVALLEQRLLENDPDRPAHRLELGCRLVIRGSVRPWAS